MGEFTPKYPLLGIPCSAVQTNLGAQLIRLRVWHGRLGIYFRGPTSNGSG